MAFLYWGYFHLLGNLLSKWFYQKPFRPWLCSHTCPPFDRILGTFKVFRALLGKISTQIMCKVRWVKIFTGSTDLSIICFTERYKAGDHNSILFFLRNFIVFSTNQKKIISNLSVLKKLWPFCLFWFFITQLSLC